MRSIVPRAVRGCLCCWSWAVTVYPHCRPARPTDPPVALRRRQADTASPSEPGGGRSEAALLPRSRSPCGQNTGGTWMDASAAPLPADDHCTACGISWRPAARAPPVRWTLSKFFMGTLVLRIFSSVFLPGNNICKWQLCGFEDHLYTRNNSFDMLLFLEKLSPSCIIGSSFHPHGRRQYGNFW